MTDAETSAAERPKALTVRGATFLGIGSMIGAGIFALLGEAGAVAGAAVWLSFLVGGVVALLLGYVCVKLATRYFAVALDGWTRRSRVRNGPVSPPQTSV